ncbi:MAG TPA: SDR family NAD(P)-dependent oxidoreductase [Gemmatimonadaceae bacterium]|jgi:acyl transferase domain-containing protein/protein-L-isoaspartate O-methyltransferase
MSDFLTRISSYSPKRLALLADDLQRRLDQAERARHEPIAIVGIGCRFPGGASTPDAYWSLLNRGVDAITEVPADRWDIDAYFDADPDAPGKMSTRFGGFIGDVSGFDPHFFGISPREAHRMDPQQRLLLEVAWEALEHGGINADRLAGSRTGVFVGMSAIDYVQTMRDVGLRSFDAYTASGGAHSIASGRLSYLLGAHGPSVSVDTACSSSLVAIHQAVGSLRRGESDLALAGGVNLILRPDVTIALSKSHMMSPDGRCKAFDARADGFVRAEGCGMLVLKRLSDAQSSNDTIIAVINGSAANQDGRSNGLTAPNGPAQEAVLRAALADARMDARQVQFVEAHGTGTSLGDPIEVRALAAVYGDRPLDEPLLVGSVKSTIGHLEASAGVAALIKAALCVQRGMVLPQQHFVTPNPFIAWDEIAVRVPTKASAWPTTTDGARAAGVSSFGFSGTNVHLIVSAAPSSETTVSATTGVERPRHVLAISAQHDRPRAALVDAYRRVLAQGELTLADAAFTANAGRAALPDRAIITACTRDEAIARLDELARGELSSNVKTGIVPSRAPRIAFLFTGQGSQWAGMASALYTTQPRFRAVLDDCDRILRARTTTPLLPMLLDADAGASIDATEHTQPALFAIEYALAELWRSWGIEPVAVAGHSVGEYVAACVAGVLSLEDALLLVAERGRLMGALPTGGAMAAMLTDEARVRSLISAWPRDIEIAAINASENIVISGRAPAIDAAIERAKVEGINATRLVVSHAFHSMLMEPMLDELERVAATVTYRPATIDVISNVTGERMPRGATTARYWREHVRAPVQFARSVETLAALGCDAFLEAGPHPTLLGLARQTLGDDARLWLPSLRRNTDAWTTLLDSLTTLYLHGAPVDWDGFDAGYARKRVVLPSYPFQRERYWIEPSAEAEVQPIDHLHALLDREVVQAASDARVFELHVSAARFPFLADHRIHGAPLVPSPLWMEMAAAAGAQMFGTRAIAIEDFTMHAPLSLVDGPTTAQIIVEPEVDARVAFRIASLDTTTRHWTTRATGVLSNVGRVAPTVDVSAARASCDELVDIEQYYAWLTALGLEFGPTFRGIDELRRGALEATGRMRTPQGLHRHGDDFTMHPAVLDACFHVVGAALNARTADRVGDPFLLTHIERIAVFAPLPEAFWTRVTVERDPSAANVAPVLRARFQLVDDDGRVLVAVDGAQFERAAQRGEDRAIPSRVREMMHDIVWREATLSGEALPSPAQLRARVAPRVGKVAAENDLETYARFDRSLDRIGAAYIVRALRELGFAFALDARVHADTLAEQLGVLPRHARLFTRLLDILGEEGILARDGDAWRVSAEPEDVLPEVRDVEAEQTKLRALVPAGDAEALITVRCARELAPVLRGQTDPLTLLFPGGSLGDMERLYQTSPPARTYNQLVADVVAEIARTWPGERPLRILEIGAGTGSTTAYVLPTLARVDVEYTFTDVSPLFLNRANEKFREQKGMRYAVLDISSDLSVRELPSAHFDVIIGANVLHATPDVDVTLQNVRRLLASGGALLLLEGATQKRFGDLTVGMLDGWWAFTDTHRRSYALMSRETWLDALRSAGFSMPTVIVDADAGGVLAQQAIYVAQEPSVHVDAGRSRWLIIPDRSGVAAGLDARLRELGDDVVVLDDRQALGDAIANAARRSNAISDVVDLRALDVLLDDDTTPARLWSDQETLMTGALQTVQTLGAANIPPAVWFVTSGAQATHTGESCNPAQTTLWGMSYVVSAEHPELRCRRVDLDPRATIDHAVSRLVTELRASSREDQIALRDDRRLVRRLVHRAPAASTRPIAIAPDRAYFITGGLRGLGLRVAEWLVANGARFVVLMGRRAADAKGESVLANLRALGATVLVVRGDVTKEEDVRRAFDESAREMPSLAGVIHAAGVLDDGVIASQNWHRFATVMGPKVLGSWHLHRLAGPLDFFAFFSSGASVAGSPGQANHAAANAFEDALAWYRQSKGLPTVSINWGPWAEIGAAAERHVTGPGFLGQIAPQDGLIAFDASLRRDGEMDRLASSQVAVLAADWSRLDSTGAAMPIYRELASVVKRAVTSAVTAASAELSLRERLRAAAPNRRRVALQDHVRRLTAKVLGVASAESLDVNEPLRQMGLDSLMAVELRNLLAKAVERPMPATITFDHPSVSALTAFIANDALADLLGEPRPETPNTIAAPVLRAPLPAIDLHDDLSEEELAAQLERHLNSLMNGNSL